MVLNEVTAAQSNMGRVLSSWDSYSDCLSSLQAWLEQDSVRHSRGDRAQVRSQHAAHIWSFVVNHVTKLSVIQSEFNGSWLLFASLCCEAQQTFYPQSG